MTETQYRALGKQHTNIQRRISMTVDKKEIVRKRLRTRHTKAERTIMKQWDTRIGKLEKQLKVIENRLEYYEHA